MSIPDEDYPVHPPDYCRTDPVERVCTLLNRGGATLNHLLLVSYLILAVTLVAVVSIIF